MRRGGGCPRPITLRSTARCWRPGPRTSTINRATKARLGAAAMAGGSSLLVHCQCWIRPACLDALE